MEVNPSPDSLCSFTNAQGRVARERDASVPRTAAADQDAGESGASTAGGATTSPLGHEPLANPDNELMRSSGAAETEQQETKASGELSSMVGGEKETQKDNQPHAEQPHVLLKPHSSNVNDEKLSKAFDRTGDVNGYGGGNTENLSSSTGKDEADASEREVAAEQQSRSDSGSASAAPSIQSENSKFHTSALNTLSFAAIQAAQSLGEVRPQLAAAGQHQQQLEYQQHSFVEDGADQVNAASDIQAHIQRINDTMSAHEKMAAAASMLEQSRCMPLPALHADLVHPISRHASSVSVDGTPAAGSMVPSHIHPEHQHQHQHQTIDQNNACMVSMPYPSMMMPPADGRLYQFAANASDQLESPMSIAVLINQQRMLGGGQDPASQRQLMAMLGQYNSRMAMSNTSNVSSAKRRKQQCPTCHGWFSNLTTHQSNHLDVNSRPHRCESCGKGFARPNDLFRHQRIHQRGAQFQCPLYVKVPASDSVLSQHSPACHATGRFTRRDTYKNHLKAVHFVYPAGTKKRERAGMGGHCKACGAHFDLAETWITDHIESKKCPAIQQLMK